MDNRVVLFLGLAALLLVGALFIQSYTQLSDLPSDDYDYLISVNSGLCRVDASNGTMLVSDMNDSYCFNYATENGGLVKVTAGEYSLDTPILVTEDETSLFGVGVATIIRQDTSGADGIVVTGENCRISDLMVSSTVRGNHGILLDSTAYETQVFRTEVTFMEYGIFSNASNNIIRENRISQCTYGVYLDTSHDGLFAGNTIETCITKSFYGKTLYSYQIENNIIEDANLTFHLYSCSHMIVEGNSFNGVNEDQTQVVYLEGVTNSVFSDNIIMGTSATIRNNGHGLTAYGNDLLIEGNVINNTASGSYDIYINSGNRVRVLENVCLSPDPTYSIRGGGGAVAAHVEGNYVKKAILLSGGGIVRGNVGFITENYVSGGNSTATTYVTAHGLAAAANYVVASFNDTALTGYTWTANSTHVTVTVQGTPASASWISYVTLKYVP